MGSGVSALECQRATDPVFICKSREFLACEIKVDETIRNYCQHSPQQGGDLPIVLAFHGAGGKSGAMVNLLRSYTEQSMVMIVPQSRITRHMGDCSSRWRQIGDTYSDWEELFRKDSCDGGTGLDDLSFMEKLLDEIERQTPNAQKYALGFSNGGDFVFQMFMTAELVKRFDGFATSGAGLKGQKVNAMVTAGNGTYKTNTNIRRPFIMQIGTLDKKNLQVQALAQAVDENPDCLPINTAEEVFTCLLNVNVTNGDKPFDMPTRRSETRDWLVEFNGVDLHRNESLYPNLGLGAEPSDNTMTVREDYRPGLDPDSAAVAVLTTIDGGHDWPGWGGNRAPCPKRNCDVDYMHEIIQFWRSHAGMKLPLP
jgi:poly(3-hydroxybutyrate) depolymerase